MANKVLKTSTGKIITHDGDIICSAPKGYTVTLNFVSAGEKGDYGSDWYIKKNGELEWDGTNADLQKRHATTCTETLTGVTTLCLLNYTADGADFYFNGTTYWSYFNSAYIGGEYQADGRITLTITSNATININTYDVH